MACVNGDEYHDGTQDDFGCKIHTIALGNNGSAGRKRKLTGLQPKPKNSWERGIVRDPRGMPLLANTNGKLSEVNTKFYAENRSKMENLQRKLHNS